MTADARPAATALVTGSSGAIGSAICHGLARAGMHVVGADKVAPNRADARWDHVTADLTREEDLDVVWRTVDTLARPLSVLVNNAGAYRALSFEQITAADFDAIMHINARAPLRLSQEFARRLIALGQPGSIVNITSVSGRIGSPDVAYGASKGALIAMTKSLGIVLAPHDIRVNSIAPGLIESEMLDRIPADRRERYRRQTPLGRFGTPAEVARLVVALCTGGDAYMSGAVIDVNGGLS